ncbi:MAG TPA: hypothetical protein PKA49_07585 [Tepidiformaceae bacterium]|nr:hypothetical protein [Tepidiformaceae bacterium]
MPWIVSMFIAAIVCSAIFFVGRTISRATRDGDPAGSRGTIIRVAAVGLFVVWVVVHTGQHPPGARRERWRGV